MRLAAVLTLIALGSLGCANPVNERIAIKYVVAGDLAVEAGDLATAKEAYWRALRNAQIGNLGPDAEAECAHKLGVVLGNLCEHDAAESAFLLAVAAKEQMYGKDSSRTFPARAELAQHAYDAGRYDKAVLYFEQAFVVGGNILVQKDPASYAEMLDDYSEALSSVGKSDAATEAKREADALRVKAAGAAPQVTKAKDDYVRYPKTCR